MSQWNRYCITEALKVNHILYDVACLSLIIVSYPPCRSLKVFLSGCGREDEGLLPHWISWDKMSEEMCFCSLKSCLCWRTLGLCDPIELTYLLWFLNMSHQLPYQAIMTTKKHIQTKLTAKLNQICNEHKRHCAGSFHRQFCHVQSPYGRLSITFLGSLFEIYIEIEIDR